MEKVAVVFDPVAYLKMRLLVARHETECAWHGVVVKGDTPQGTAYFVKNILVYPQIATQTTVENDDEQYLQWQMELDMETANNLRLQGHSHVNMSTSPSCTDIENQCDILKQTGCKGFYIFMITNKRSAYWFGIADFEDHKVYGPDQVVIKIEGMNFCAEEWLEKTDELIKIHNVKEAENELIKIV